MRQNEERERSEERGEREEGRGRGGGARGEERGGWRMCHGCWRETSKRERGKEKEEERARERERDRNDRRDRERRDRERERKDRDRKFVNLRTPKKTNANPSCVSPATRPVGSRHGVRAKISDFCAKPGFSPFPRYQKFGACGKCVVSYLNTRDGP